MNRVRLKIIILLLWLFPFVSYAQVSVLSVTDENQYTQKDEFSHTFEYHILPLTKNKDTVGKCQATRLSRRWFVTAAHCVRSCSAGCKIEMDLLEQSTSARASVTHTPKNPAVFVDPEYSPRTFVKHDMALIRLDLDNTPLIYYRRGTEKDPVNRLLTKKQFNRFLARHPQARSALSHVQNPSFPPILVFDEGNYRLDRTLSVISIFSGKRTVKINTAPVHYVKELGYAYTSNFGIIHGMSGSGVMSNTGELVGLISGVFQVTKIPAPGSQAAPSSQEFFMFFAFNQPAIEFMKSVMGSDFDKLEIKDAYPAYVSKSRQNYKRIIQQVQSREQSPS